MQAAKAAVERPQPQTTVRMRTTIRMFQARWIGQMQAYGAATSLWGPGRVVANQLSKPVLDAFLTEVLGLEPTEATEALQHLQHYPNGSYANLKHGAVIRERFHDIFAFDGKAKPADPAAFWKVQQSVFGGEVPDEVAFLAKHGTRALRAWLHSFYGLPKVSDDQYFKLLTFLTSIVVYDKATDT